MTLLGRPHSSVKQGAGVGGLSVLAGVTTLLERHVHVGGPALETVMNKLMVAVSLLVLSSGPRA